MATDTFGEYGTVDITEREDRLASRRRLLSEDSALRPWLIGPALRSYRFSFWERVKYVVRETCLAAIWSWRLSGGE